MSGLWNNLPFLFFTYEIFNMEAAILNRKWVVSKMADIGELPVLVWWIGCCPFDDNSVLFLIFFSNIPVLWPFMGLWKNNAKILVIFSWFSQKRYYFENFCEIFSLWGKLSINFNICIPFGIAEYFELFSLGTTAVFII